jgi:hypothetical protein
MFKKASTREEWIKVYDPFKDPELFAEAIFIRNRFQNLGVMLKEGVVDSDLLYKIHTPSSIIITWEHYKPNILARRIENNDPNHMIEFEYLYNETKKRYPEITPTRREHE